VLREEGKKAEALSAEKKKSACVCVCVCVWKEAEAQRRGIKKACVVNTSFFFVISKTLKKKMCGKYLHVEERRQLRM
jgi:hypothetical protein